MPGYAPLEGTLGLPPAGDIFVPDTTQRWQLGQIFTGIDPFFGFGEFVYGKAAQASGVGRVLYFSDNVYTATDAPNTALLGRALVVPVANMAINTFGWFCVRGQRPWLANAATAVGTSFGLTAAGTVGTLAAGKQILNAQITQTGTFAPTKANCTSVNGSPVLGVPNVDGLFVGLTVTGTGISGTISAVDPSGNKVTLSANATATGSITATFTWTNFLLVMSNGAIAQGAIT